VTDDPTASRSGTPPISWARNGEDVVLLRALGDVTGGRFLEFQGPGADTAVPGAASPPALQALRDRGWTGAVGTLAEMADPSAIDRLLATLGTGELHVVLVAADLDPADPEPVLELARRGPWVLVVGVHPEHDRAPMTQALRAAGYRLRLYDGVSAYYVAAAHAEALGPALSYPACARDRYLPRSAHRMIEAARQQQAQALESALRWREKAVRSWADNSTGGVADREELLQLREHADDLAKQLELLQETLSWRVTAPLRRVRRRGTARSAS
jgi:hypothetical protein